MGQVLRGSLGTGGRELEFIVRSLVELKLQVEELRARVHAAGPQSDFSGARISAGTESSPARVIPGNGLRHDENMDVSSAVGAIEPPGEPAPPRVITLTPGMTMAEIERAAIQGALAATKGNRRKAAEMLGIGERTMYRKLRDYEITVQ